MPHTAKVVEQPAATEGRDSPVYNPPMETFVEAGAGRLWTVTEGEGVPVVLCPGGPGCCDYLAPVARLLDEVARTVRYDPRGCGRSAPAGEYTVADAVADLEAIREHYGFERWVVAGHSWGADLALAYTLEHPDRVAGFVCISGGRVHDDREWHRIYAERRDAGLEAPLDYAYPPNMDVNRELAADWKRYIKRPGLLRDLARIERPGLFVYGERDIRPSWPVEQVAALIPGARLHLLEGAAHNLWLTHGEEVGGLLREFVLDQRERFQK